MTVTHTFMARTETVTVMFSDLVSSTDLASRLGHDAYEIPGSQKKATSGYVAQHLQCKAIIAFSCQLRRYLSSTVSPEREEQKSTDWSGLA